MFAMCIIIEILTRKDIMVYIGFFNIAKAFDKVPRVKTLIDQGIGNFTSIETHISSHNMYNSKCT